MKLEDDDGVVLVYELRDCETGRPTIVFFCYKNERNWKTTTVLWDVTEIGRAHV